MFYAVDKARELATHTIVICSNEKIFEPKYSKITQKIIDVSLSIYENAWTANNVLVKNADDWMSRRKFQLIAAAKCNSLLALIQLSKRLYHLRSKKVKYWSKLAIETRGLIRKWHEADQERYGEKYE